MYKSYVPSLLSIPQIPPSLPPILSSTSFIGIEYGSKIMRLGHKTTKPNITVDRKMLAAVFFLPIFILSIIKHLPDIVYTPAAPGKTILYLLENPH